MSESNESSDEMSGDGTIRNRKTDSGESSTSSESSSTSSESSSRWNMKTIYLLSVIVAVCAVAVPLLFRWCFPIPYKNCVKPPALEHGSVTFWNTTSGAAAQYECDLGYVLMGSKHSSSKCDGSDWSEPPTCKQIDCGVPPSFEGVQKRFEGTTTVNALAEYECSAGYIMAGNGFKVCQSSGEWSGGTPTCNAVQCPSLSSPPNGAVSYGRTAYKSAAVYSCSDGFELRGGESKRTCTEDGLWTGSPPYCIDTTQGTKDHKFDLLPGYIKLVAQIAELYGEDDTSASLKRMVQYVVDPKIRIGLIGVIKSGKSTVLNSLLGNKFLPSSVEPQSATEVRVSHADDNEYETGVLFDTEEVARGTKKIYEVLYAHNRAMRSENPPENKVFLLKTPIPFVSSSLKQSVFGLEVSDTVGINEAGVPQATNKTIEVMEKLSIFVVVLNYKRMKTVSEENLIKKLLEVHPKVFENTNKYLFVVNAVDIYFLTENPDSVHPENVSHFISGYLKDNLDLNIPTDRIIPYCAKWILLYRVTQAGGVVSDSEYQQALALYSSIKSMSDIRHLQRPTDDNTREVFTTLKNYCGIDRLESELMRMVSENGESNLYENAATTALHFTEVLMKKLALEEKVRNTETARNNFKQKRQQLQDLYRQAAKWKQSYFQIVKAFISTFDSSVKKVVQNSLSEMLSNINHTDFKDKFALSKWEALMSEAVAEVFGKMKEDYNNAKKAYALEKHIPDWDDILSQVSYNSKSTVERIKWQYEFVHGIESLHYAHLHELNTEPENDYLLGNLTDLFVDNLQAEVRKILFQVHNGFSCQRFDEKVSQYVTEHTGLLKQEFYDEQPSHSENLSYLKHVMDNLKLYTVV